MGRLYNELLKQLKTAEEEKEKLQQSKAKHADTRESSISQEANSLREQLDQCLQRLMDEQNCAAESSRQAEEERANLKNALVSANSRLAKMDALEADTKAQAEELKELREERRERDASLAEEHGRTQHLAGALRDLELESAALNSREREAVSRAESLEQELHNLESKVSELSLRCEELQKHVVVLQSGEEIQGSRRKAAEAFALAERQDELLEDASTRLGHLKAESKLLQEELARARESSKIAKNILEPVLQGARSQLGLESDGSCDRHPTAMAAATRKQRRKEAHSFNSGCGSQEDFEVENGGGQRQARLDEGGEDEVELEDLAREAADVLLHMLVGAEVGHGTGESEEPEGRNGMMSCAATRFQDAREHAWASTRRRGSARRNSQSKGPLHTSNLTASSPRWGIEDAEEELQSRHHRRRPVDQGTPDHGGACRAKDGSASIGGNYESASTTNRATSISAENRGGTGGTRAKSSCELSPGAVHHDHRSGVGGRRRARSERGVAGAEAVAMPDHDAVRRIEGIRRGGGEDGGATLLHGVKSTRRGHLQGGRPPTSIADSWMNTLLDGSRLSASAERDTLLSTALAGNSRPRAWVRGGRDDSRQRTTSLGCQSPSTRKICQRIHDAQTALQALRRTTD
ncbi:unnamed protein product [Ectocarpus sp. 4 AP-2014]